MSMERKHRKIETCIHDFDWMIVTDHRQKKCSIFDGQSDQTKYLSVLENSWIDLKLGLDMAHKWEF